MEEGFKMNRGMCRYTSLALTIVLGISSMVACTNIKPLQSATPAGTTMLETAMPTPTPSPYLPMPSPTLSASPTVSPAASPTPVPVIAAGTKPFLPIHSFEIADDKSVYYVNDPSEVYKRDVSSNKKAMLVSYDNPIHQMFLDYNRNLYYLVYGYSDTYDDGECHGWLYKYSEGKDTLLLSDIRGVCGINDKYIYFYKETIYHEEGYYIDEVYCYDLVSAETSMLFTLKGGFDSWTGYFSSGDFIYYTLENAQYSYNTRTGNM